LYVIIKFPEYTKDTFDADQAEEGNESLQVCKKEKKAYAFYV
jgi:hypothetical protein